MLGGHFFVAMCKTLEYVVSMPGTAEYCNDSDNYTRRLKTTSGIRAVFLSSA